MSLSEKKDSKRCTIESYLISDNRLSIRILFAYRFRHYPRVTCTSSHAELIVRVLQSASVRTDVDTANRIYG